MKRSILTFIAALAVVIASAQTDTLTANHPEYLPTIEIGTVAPEICAPDTLGKKIFLSDY